jgi:citronellol/citronellal dehydrogenase
MPPPQLPDLSGKVAIITGASRGIGRECALTLARRGCRVVLAAKTADPTPSLPGTIHTVAQEVRSLGGRALPFLLDVRDAESCRRCAEAAVAEFGQLDILINNASALWWHDIEATPIKKYDLINTINARGTFAMTQACLPHMRRHGFGRVITMSPPIHLHNLSGRTAYYVSKFGMTLVALGVAQENLGKGITGNSLWPATIIESQASINFRLLGSSNWRKAAILADATAFIVGEPDTFTGHMLLDDEYLRTKGYTDADFVQYRCDPTVEPPRLLAQEIHGTVGDALALLKRGDVRKVEDDVKASSKL